jgi:hypothetical protein
MLFSAILGVRRHSRAGSAKRRNPLAQLGHMQPASHNRIELAEMILVYAKE